MQGGVEIEIDSEKGIFQWNRWKHKVRKSTSETDRAGEGRS